MAGTINLALTQQLDEYGEPLSGGQLYIIQAGTISTPQNPYQDTALSIAMPNPITLDAAGRIPQFFLADGQIKVRLQDVHGVVKFQQDNLLVIGPSAGGGGGGGSVDPTTVMQTGDMKIRYDNAIISGFVRLNGKTIGSASSGGTELADPSAQALFSHLWTKDTTLVVSPGGRGASAAADWAANKQIAVPDFRGYGIACLDDMGNTAAGRYGSYFANPTTLGSAGGAPSVGLAAGNLPPHTHSGTTGTDSPDHTHNYSVAVGSGNQKPAGAGTAPFDGLSATTTGGANARHAHSFTTDSGAGLVGSPFAAFGPRKLITAYMKL